MSDQSKRPPDYYRVQESRNISWYGNMTAMVAGARIDPSGYGGDDGILRLMEQGVKLIPCWGP